MVRPVGPASSLLLCGNLLVMRGFGDARCTTSEGSVVNVDVTVGCSLFTGGRFLLGASGETVGVPSEGRKTHKFLVAVSPPPRCRPMRPSWPPLCFRRCFGRCSDGRCGSRPVVTAALPSPVPPSRVCFRRDVCGCQCGSCSTGVVRVVRRRGRRRVVAGPRVVALPCRGLRAVAEANALQQRGTRGTREARAAGGVDVPPVVHDGVVGAVPEHGGCGELAARREVNGAGCPRGANVCVFSDCVAFPGASTGVGPEHAIIDARC